MRQRTLKEVNTSVQSFSSDKFTTATNITIGKHKPPPIKPIKLKNLIKKFMFPIENQWFYTSRCT